jgi:hypothetical protein
MSRIDENDELKNKIINAASNSYNENRRELDKLGRNKLAEVAYLHGYNCGHNIYDVAEEKIDVLMKNGEVGEVPQKDYPTVSENGNDKAMEYIKFNESNISGMDSKDTYVDAYQKGFQEAWNDIPTKAINDKMYEIVNYYLK